MYAEFLKGLADIAEKLNEVAQMGTDEGVGTPYVAGKLEVRSHGDVVGHFEFIDEFVVYTPKDESK